MNNVNVYIIVKGNTDFLCIDVYKGVWNVMRSILQ